MLPSRYTIKYTISCSTQDYVTVINSNLFHVLTNKISFNTSKCLNENGISFRLSAMKAFSQRNKSNKNVLHAIIFVKHLILLYGIIVI